MPSAQQVIADLERRLADLAAADAAYDLLDGTANGKPLNPDAARRLSPYYRTVEQCLAFTYCTAAPAGQYIHGRYDRTLPTTTRPAPARPEVLFLAGGAASGKTEAARTLVATRAFDLIFDSNLGNAVRARQMIDGAVDLGCEVTVFYVHRTFAHALINMVMRAAYTGRYIPLVPGAQADLAVLHFRAQRTICELAEQYADSEGVVIQAAWNRWNRHTGEKRIDLLDLASLAPGGAHHYGSLELLHADQRSALEGFRDQQVANAAVLRAIAENPD